MLHDCDISLVHVCSLILLMQRGYEFNKKNKKNKDSVSALQSQLQLTHCRLNELIHIIYWKSLILILGMSGYVILIFLEKNG